MSENVNKNEVLAEKIARRKLVTSEIKEMRSVGNYDGAEFLLNELRGLKSVERATTKQLNRLKKMNKFKKDYLDGASKKRRAIGDNGIPTNEKERTKIGKIYKKSARDLNRFLGKEHEDLKR